MGPCKYERHRWENEVNQILCFVFINETECPSINLFPCALQPSQQITSCVPAVPLSQNSGHPFMQWLLQPEVKGVFIVTLKYPIKVLWWIDIGNGERICLFIVIPGLGRGKAQQCSIYMNAAGWLLPWACHWVTRRTHYAASASLLLSSTNSSTIFISSKRKALVNRANKTDRV